MLFFFSAGAVCVSLNGQRNVLVYSISDLAPNDLLEGKKRNIFTLLSIAIFLKFHLIMRFSPRNS